MYLKWIGRAAAALSCAVLLTGCGTAVEEKWEPRQAAAISIDDAGQITEYLSESLEQPYYSFDELNSMLNAEAASYNSAHGEGRVTVESAELAEGKANLVIVYASAADYAAFNNVEFYYGSMINAQLEGYLFDGSYKRVSDGVVTEDALSGSDVLKHMADEVLIVQAPMEVHVPGTLHFVSSSADVLRTDAAAAAKPQTEDGASWEEEKASGRVYLVFEK